jgi:GR25 family glycosyltransferase involved in LPS biosynthesis
VTSVVSSGLVVDGLDVPVFVVNLDSRPDRWHLLQDRLRAIGLTGERVAALTGPDATESGYTVEVPDHQKAEWHVSPGGLGCAATHIEIYRRVAASIRPGALILEDDVVLPEDFVPRAQAALTTRSPHTAVISLGWLFYSRSLRSRLRDVAHHVGGTGSRDRLAVAPFAFGTHCYWVSREFAMAAPQLMTPVYAPIDAMLRAITHYSSWQCEVHWPPLATQDQSPSDIR